MIFSGATESFGCYPARMPKRSSYMAMVVTEMVRREWTWGTQLLSSENERDDQRGR